MKIKTYSYRYAEEILQHPNNIEIYNEIIDICKGCPVPVYKEKSDKQKGKDVIQQLMNTYFYEAFAKRGWEDEPYASPDNMDDSLRADFRKKFKKKNKESISVQIEVEFGNVASSYRNYFKFQLSFSYGLADICVIIVPSTRLAKRIDSGVSNFEKVVREIPSANLSITVPILVIGLFDVDDKEKEIDIWDIKKEGVTLKIAKDNKDKEHHKIVIKYLERIKNAKK